MWSPRWEFEYDSKTNSVKATKKSLCCPAKCIVAFKHCLLIKNQQKRITRCSVCRESCHTTPIKAPIHMKAISRQRQLFRSSPPCQPPVCSSTGVWQSVFVCVITLSAAGEASLLLVPATSPPECRQPLPVPGRSPGSARLYVCQTEESPSVTLLSSFLRGKWKASLTALLIGSAPSSRRPGCQLSTLWIDHIKHSYSSVWCTQHCTVLGKRCIRIFMKHKHRSVAVKLGIMLTLSSQHGKCFLKSTLKYFKLKSLV